MEFNERVVAAMEKQGMTQTDLAKATGLSQQMLSKIILGKTTDPRLSTVLLIADALDVSLSYLGGCDA